MIFKATKKLKIGTLLKAGILGFTGNVSDINGKIVGDNRAVVIIVKEVTKKEFLNQFEQDGIKINDSTLRDIDESYFYEIATD